MNKEFEHIPVLKVEVTNALAPQPGKRYIDATIGGGGHTQEILEKGGEVLGIDQDSDAIQAIQDRFGNKVILVQSNFENIKKIARENNFVDIDGILLDIGVSSHQINTPERGFSYRFDASLDMRMDTGSGEKSAMEVINGYSQEDLSKLFTKYGELNMGDRIAQAIRIARKKDPIRTTDQLLSVIEKELGTLPPVTKSQIFQAIRIEVNDEIGRLRRTLPDAFELLKSGGRLCVISFHSLEDRTVKEFGRKKEKEGVAKIVTKKPITATDEEVRQNKRSKSAKLRVIEKI